MLRLYEKCIVDLKGRLEAAGGKPGGNNGGDGNKGDDGSDQPKNSKTPGGSAPGGQPKVGGIGKRSSPKPSGSPKNNSRPPKPAANPQAGGSPPKTSTDSDSFDGLKTSTPLHPKTGKKPEKKFKPKKKPKKAKEAPAPHDPTFGQSEDAVADSQRSKPLTGEGLAVRTFGDFMERVKDKPVDDRLVALKDYIELCKGKIKRARIKTSRASWPLQMTWAQSEIERLKEAVEENEEEEDGGNAAAAPDGDDDYSDDSDDDDDAPNNDGGASGAGGKPGRPPSEPNADSNGNSAGSKKSKTPPPKPSYGAGSKDGKEPGADKAGAEDSSSDHDFEAHRDLLWAQKANDKIEDAREHAPSAEQPILERHNYWRGILQQGAEEDATEAYLQLVREECHAQLEFIDEELRPEEPTVRKNLKRLADEDANAKRRSKKRRFNSETRKLLNDEDFRFQLGNNADMLRRDRRTAAGVDRLMDEVHAYSPDEMIRLRRGPESQGKKSGGTQESIAFKLALLAAGRAASPIGSDTLDYYDDELGSDDGESNVWYFDVEDAQAKQDVLDWNTEHLLESRRSKSPAARSLRGSSGIKSSQDKNGKRAASGESEASQSRRSSKMVTSGGNGNGGIS
jgi:hypothetical protein